MRIINQDVIPSRKTCQKCKLETTLDFDFSMAFQPIVDCKARRIFGYEALVRGKNNEPAWSVISRVTDENRYAFDQACRVKAITLASKLEMPGFLSINFLPNAVYKAERCIRTTLDAASKYKFPIEKIMFEFTEGEKIENIPHLKDIVEHYQSLGFITAIDDFGAGYSGLALLCEFQPNIVKLDMNLIRNANNCPTKQIILSHSISMLHHLRITPLAEGVETKGELGLLLDLGVYLMQGYLFAKPGFEHLPPASFAMLD